VGYIGKLDIEVKHREKIEKKEEEFIKMSPHFTRD
jgi:hypothetical protein